MNTQKEMKKLIVFENLAPQENWINIWKTKTNTSKSVHET